MSEQTYVRKDRQDRVSGRVKHGRTHAQQDGLTLCGRRIKGIAHHQRLRPDESLLCPTCLTHERKGTRRAWKGR